MGVAFTMLLLPSGNGGETESQTPESCLGAGLWGCDHPGGDLLVTDLRSSTLGKSSAEHSSPSQSRTSFLGLQRAPVEGVSCNTNV